MIKCSLLIGLVLVISCQTQQDNKVQPSKEKPISSEAIQKSELHKGMANPVMLSAAGGVDVGRLFNAYYRTGKLNYMYHLLDSQTKKSFSKEKALQLLADLDYGYDMKLSNASNEGPNFVLVYICQIAQTKVVKQLKVVVENDTARVVPKDLLNGKIFFN
jgi:hypothetical protein